MLFPPEIRSQLADEGVRTHHHLWQFVRDRARWAALPEHNKDELRRLGWAPPRTSDEIGAGVDFLWTYRLMLEVVERGLRAAGAELPAWRTIPWRPEDATCPVPEWPDAPEWSHEARSAARLEEIRVAARRLREEATLVRMPLDELGRCLESTLFAWACLRWAAPPNEVDWMAAPWSAHVNPIFWSLQGWIAGTVTRWERVHDRLADLSGGWAGPVESTGELPRAEPRLLRLIPPRTSVPVIPVIADAALVRLAA